MILAFVSLNEVHCIDGAGDVDNVKPEDPHVRSGVKVEAIELDNVKLVDRGHEA